MVFKSLSADVPLGRMNDPALEFIGAQNKIVLTKEHRGEESPYERLLRDAMRGKGTLFSREDMIDAAWTVVDPVLSDHRPVEVYEKGIWGPKSADSLIAHDGEWHNPKVAKGTK